MATVSPRELSLVLVEPSDEEAIGQWYELRSAVVRADWPGYPPPCWVHELGGFRHPWPGKVEKVWVARVAGLVVGGCLLNLPMLDNQRNARGEILVAPGHRGAASVGRCSPTCGLRPFGRAGSGWWSRSSSHWRSPCPIRQGSSRWRPERCRPGS